MSILIGRDLGFCTCLVGGLGGSGITVVCFFAVLLSIDVFCDRNVSIDVYRDTGIQPSMPVKK